jgi:hypothetical protein
VNFRIVAQELRSVFEEHAAKAGNNELRTQKFYTVEGCDEARYRRLSDNSKHTFLSSKISLWS